MKKLLRSGLKGGLFALFLVANPAYFTGCASADDEFTYDEADMLAVVERANDQKTWAFDGYEIELSLQQEGGKGAAEPSGNNNPVP